MHVSDHRTVAMTSVGDWDALHTHMHRCEKRMSTNASLFDDRRSDI